MRRRLAATSIAPQGERRSAWPMHGWIATVGILGLVFVVLAL